MESTPDRPGAFVFEITLRSGVIKRISGDDLTHDNAAGHINVSVRPTDQGMSRIVYTTSARDVMDVTRLDAEVSIFTPAPAQDEESAS